MRKTVFVSIACLVLVLALSGCSGGDNDNGKPLSSAALRAQIEFWENGVPAEVVTIPLVNSTNPTPPAVKIIRGRQFRIIAQVITTANGKEVVTPVDPITSIGKFTFGEFPADKVVEWFDTSQGWFYHLDEQFPDQTFCASGVICEKNISFRFTPVCTDQLP